MKNRGEENQFEVIFDFGLILKSADDSPKSFLFPKPAEHKLGAPFLGPTAEDLIFPMSRENGKLFGELGKVFEKSVELAGFEDMVVATEIGDGALFDLSFVSVAFDNAEVGVRAGFLFPDKHVITANIIIKSYMSRDKLAFIVTTFSKYKNSRIANNKVTGFSFHQVLKMSISVRLIS